MPTNDPAVAQIQLGLLLRSLRTANNVTAVAAGKAIGTSNATISRVENGKQGIKTADLVNLLDFYRAPDATVAEAMRLLSARGPRSRRRNSAYRDGVPNWFQRFLALEAEATDIAIYDNELVTGLFQTEAYARVLLQAGAPLAGRAEIDKLVGLRMRRQDVLKREEPPALRVIMMETVLHRVIGDDEIMAGQMRKLLRVSRMPRVELRILPFRPVATTDDDAFAARVNFMLLRLPEQGVVLYQEDFTGATYPEDYAAIEQYARAFERLGAAAADPKTSRDMIASMVKQYE